MVFKSLNERKDSDYLFFHLLFFRWNLYFIGLEMRAIGQYLVPEFPNLYFLGTLFHFIFVILLLFFFVFHENLKFYQFKILKLKKTKTILSSK